MNQPRQSIPVIYSPRQQQSSPRLLIESKDQQQQQQESPQSFTETKEQEPQPIKTQQQIVEPSTRRRLSNRPKMIRKINNCIYYINIRFYLFKLLIFLSILFSKTFKITIIIN